MNGITGRGLLLRLRPNLLTINFEGAKMTQVKSLQAGVAAFPTALEPHKMKPPFLFIQLTGQHIGMESIGD
jgi:hypothetical protein